MSLAVLLDAVTSQLHELTRGFWNDEDDELARRQRKSQRLNQKLRRRYAQLIRHRSASEGLRQQLAARERPQMQRPLIDAERAQQREELHRHERAYQSLLNDVVRLKRRLTDLRKEINGHQTV